MKEAGLIFPENVKTVEANATLSFAEIEPPDLGFLRTTPGGDVWLRKLSEAAREEQGNNGSSNCNNSDLKPANLDVAAVGNHQQQHPHHPHNQQPVVAVAPSPHPHPLGFPPANPVLWPSPQPPHHHPWLQYPPAL